MRERFGGGRFAGAVANALALNLSEAFGILVAGGRTAAETPPSWGTIDMHKKDVAGALEEIAILLELTGANPFKCRAYSAAARTLERVTGDLETLIETGELKKVKGIGRSLFEKIVELAETGRSAYIDQLRAEVPEGLIEMLHIPGFGPKRARLVNRKLGIATLDELEAACEGNRLSDLEGFGKRMEEKILEGITFLKRHRGRVLYADALPQARALLEVVQACPQTVKARIAGSIRRGKETVKDVDIIAAVTDSGPVMDAFTAAGGVETIAAKGDTKSSIVLRSGLAADLRTVDEDAFPCALNHFTGSADHNVAMRGRAQQKFGMKINEYGLFKGTKRIRVADERALYKKLDLDYIEPELRENTGEIEAAESGSLPALVTAEDMKGLLHVHTTASDGVDSLEAVARAVRKGGYRYLGVNDHSKAAAYAGGLSEEEVLEQGRRIDALNKGFKDFRVFKSIECDILTDGTLDYPPNVLKTLDYVIVSIHSNFNLPRERMTKRIVKALKSPYTSVLGHPSGALLLARKPYELDMEEIIRVAADLGVALELNAAPDRLDIDWIQCKAVKHAGAKVAIGVDAHSIDTLDWMAYGINIARKGWLEPCDVLNCLDVEDFLNFFPFKRRK